MTRPEQEVRKRVHLIFDMKNLAEMERRTGYNHQTLSNWRKNPLIIKAVDLIRLEQMLKISPQEERGRK